VSCYVVYKNKTCDVDPKTKGEGSKNIEKKSKYTK
jgi:hypothetical protein